MIFQFELVRPTSIQCMVLAAMVMMVVSLLFIPNVLCCFWVAFSVISIETGVVGYMALWGVSLDSISMINLIMCIGFSVDFTAHICYAYMSSKAKEPEERVRECLYALGLPIMQGAMSTILGVMVLYWAGSYIFLTFFKTVFLVIFFGAMHGILLLPVLLSLFGPGSCCPSEEELSDDDVLAEGLKIDQIRARHVARAARAPPRAPHLMHPAAYNVNVPHAQHSHLMLPFGQVQGQAKGKNWDQPADKDMGLGTSAEEESSQSSSKSGKSAAGRQQPHHHHHHQKPAPRCFQPPHLMEVYNNSGYMSDDDQRRWSRQRSSRGDEVAHYLHHHPQYMGWYRK